MKDPENIEYFFIKKYYWFEFFYFNNRMRNVCLILFQNLSLEIFF